MKYKYKLTVTFNDETTSEKTNDIKQTFMGMKPEVLKTNVFIKLQSGKRQTEKALFLPQGRKAFTDNMAAEILEKQLLLTL